MRYLSFIICLLFSVALISCTDKFEDEENNEPAWLHENIYDYLSGRGDCSYYLRLIDDCGYRETMQHTGSNTLFFSADDAFERFFKNNTLGISRYEDMSSTLKNMLLRTSIVSNAQLIERLSKNDQGTIIFRRTTTFETRDSIPMVAAGELPASSYFDALRTQAAGTTVPLLQDNSQQTLVQFFPDVMDAKKITADDYRFITGHERTGNGASLFSNEIVSADITCKNGYLHELQEVLLVPENMEQHIRHNKNLSLFCSLMTRFATPYDSNLRTAEGDTIWALRYFNNDSYEGSALTKDMNGNAVPNYLYYDPGWNLYTNEATMNGQSGYQKDMAAMFVPSDKAMRDYLSPTGDGADLYESYPTWDVLPDNIAADYVKNHQMYSLLSSLPHYFDGLKDEAGYEMGVTADDVDSVFVGRNGVIYITNRVFPPLDYRSVMGPAKMNPRFSIFRQALEDTYCQFQYYLRSIKSQYLFLITPDELMRNYLDPVSLGYNGDEQCRWDFFVNENGTVSATPYSLLTGERIETFLSSSQLESVAVDGEISTVSIIKNRLQDILDTHTLVLSNGVDGLRQALADGQEWFVTKGYAPIHIGGADKGAVIYGTNEDHSVQVTDTYEKSNGLTLATDGLLQNTTRSVYNVLSQTPEFSTFFNMCNEMGFFAANISAANHALDNRVRFFGQYHYTIYVPTNAAMAQAVSDGIIPSLDDIAQETDAEVKEEMEQRLTRFLRYHFQDDAVMVKGELLNGAAKLTSTLNEDTHQFYPVYVTNTTLQGGGITLRDMLNRTVSVVQDTALTNIMARDVVVNKGNLSQASEIEAYAFAVIHQTDNYLRWK